MLYNNNIKINEGFWWFNKVLVLSERLDGQLFSEGSEELRNTVHNGKEWTESFFKSSQLTYDYKVLLASLFGTQLVVSCLVVVLSSLFVNKSYITSLYMHDDFSLSKDI